MKIRPSERAFPRALLATIAAVVVQAAACDGCASAPNGGEGEGEGSASSGEGEGEGSASSGEGEGEGSASSGEGEGEGSASSGEGEGEGDSNALDDSLTSFCAGTGAAIDVTAGAGGSGCTGNLAADTFKFAVCACESVDLTEGNLYVDSFDSAVGVYNPNAPGEDGQVGMNGGPWTLDKQINVHGNVIVKGGSLEAGPSSVISQQLFVDGDLLDALNPTSLDIAGDAFVDGNVASGYRIAGALHVPAASTVANNASSNIVRGAVTIPTPCPCGVDQIIRVGDIVAYGLAHNDNTAVTTPIATDALNAPGSSVNFAPTECGRFVVNGVNTGTLNMTITQRTVLYVNGDFHTGSLSIDVAQGGELDLFVDGDIIIDASSNFGSPDRPAAVRTYVSGNVSLQASANFAGNIYAPTADIVFSAAGDVFGSVFVRNVSFKNTNLHFDSAIRRAGEDCTPPPAEGEGEGEGAATGEGEGEGAPACSTTTCTTAADCCPNAAGTPFCFGGSCVVVGG